MSHQWDYFRWPKIKRAVQCNQIKFSLLAKKHIKTPCFVNLTPLPRDYREKRITVRSSARSRRYLSGANCLVSEADSGTRIFKSYEITPLFLCLLEQTCLCSTQTGERPTSGCSSLFWHLPPPPFFLSSDHSPLSSPRPCLTPLCNNQNIPPVIIIIPTKKNLFF